MNSLPWLGIRPGRTHALPEAFWVEAPPTPLPPPVVQAVDPWTVARLGWDPDEARREAFGAWCAAPEAERPIATVYGGHQFGVWVPRLGDGRATLLGDVVGTDGVTYEVQVKGAGPTAFSRGGDGRSVLRSAIREFLGSIAMRGLGIPTTHAAAVVGTPAPVRRERWETAATLVRVAPSLVRFGTFEYFGSRGEVNEVRALLEHVWTHHDPDVRDAADPVVAWYRRVVERTARLFAGWQAYGFVHGVLNTDNLSVLGLTLDYGPYQFLDAFEPGRIIHHTDRNGRYVLGRQPEVGAWNLAQLGRALRAVLPVEAAEEALDQYGAEFSAAYVERLRARLGWREAREGDVELLEETLELLAERKADYARTLRALAEATPEAPGAVLAELGYTESARAWWGRYAARVEAEGGWSDPERPARLRAANPCYVLRNYLAQVAIERAEAGDMGGVERLAEALAAPFTAREGWEELEAPPPAWGRDIELSCSS